MKTCKEAGLDRIKNTFLKERDHPLSLSLCDPFTFLLCNGKMPNLLKQANATPVFKNGGPNEVSNSRPISLLGAFGKVFEKAGS